MKWPGRALWPLVALAACAGGERVEVRPPPTGELPELEVAAPPVSSVGEDDDAATDRPAIPVEAGGLADAPLSSSVLPATFAPEELQIALSHVHDAKTRKAARSVYEHRDLAYVWSNGDRLDSAAISLLDLVRDSSNHGLSPRGLGTQGLVRLAGALEWNDELLARTRTGEPHERPLKSSRRAVLADMDVALTAAALELMAALETEKPLDATNLGRWVDSLVPWHPQYARLVRARERYRNFSRFPPVLLPEDVQHVGLKGRGPIIFQLRARLVAEGFLTGKEGGAKNVFDRTLRDAVARFQFTRSLRGHGLLDRATANALNVPPKQLVAAIDGALKAWRTSPTRTEQSYVQVNLPEFMVELYQNRMRTRRHRATIGYAFGSGGGRTKHFHSHIDTITLNPGWTPSDDVVQQRLKPREAKEPGWLERHGFSTITRANGKTGLFQHPGRKNALGRVALRFPNEHNIFLHGTPDPTQFEDNVRASSLGCVRVEGVESLAEELLTAAGALNGTAFDASLAIGRTYDVRLDTPVPVHFTYVLVVVDDDTTVRFLSDVYKVGASKG